MGNYIMRSVGYQILADITDLNQVNPNLLGYKFVLSSTKNLPIVFDSTIMILSQGLMVCVPYFEDGSNGVYMRTYNTRWFSWVKII